MAMFTEGTYRKRCKRYDIAGHAHCLTFSCFHNRSFLAQNRCCEWLAEALERARRRKLFDLWAYVFMPEHVHLILLPEQGIRISAILTAIKSSTSKRAVLCLHKNAPEFLSEMVDAQPSGRSSYRFWQRGGGYDRNLRSLKDVYEKIDYIHANPVRRGLVEAPDQWFWSSYRAWQTGEDTPIAIDRESLIR
jgi:putative transposase